MEIPKEWSFKNQEVAEHFDTHVREQLPWYELALTIVGHVAKHYIPKNGRVYDIGASTGNITRTIFEECGERNIKIFPLDNSEEMAKHYKGPVPLIIEDAETYKYEPFDFAICFLVLMFIPIEKRKDLLDKLTENIRPGGCLMIVDKCLPENGYLGIVISRLAMAGKLKAGVSPEDIIDKEISLSGIQRPLNISELHNATEIFRFGDFAGWIIEK